MKMKKQKPQSVIKRKLKFEDYKHCLDTTQLEKKRLNFKFTSK